MPDAKTAALTLFDGKSLPTILRMSREWHARRAAMVATMRGTTKPENEDGDWLHGIPDWSYGNLKVVVLKSRRELANEGTKGQDDSGMDGLDHCVESYATGCEDDLHRIVSIRESTDGKTRRLSTAQIEMSKRVFETVQHRGKGNTQPEGRAIALLEDYISRLNNGDLHADPTAFSGTGYMDRPDYQRQAGYDYEQPGAFETAMRTWARFLPRHMRGWTPDEIAEKAWMSRHRHLRNNKIDDSHQTENTRGEMDGWQR
jgi:hypothetical protein